MEKIIKMSDLEEKYESKKKNSKKDKEDDRVVIIRYTDGPAQSIEDVVDTFIYSFGMKI